MYPKIELHVHLEATVAPKTLLEIARRNDYPLPVSTVEEVVELYRYRDFDHFIEVWRVTTNALRRYDDFRQVVVDYAEQARDHGGVYIEGIFSPIERVWRGVDWDEIFSGYCDGAQEARELHGVEVRLTPDITCGAGLNDAFEAVRYALRYRGRGVVGIGLGGEENLYPPEPFAPAFRVAKDSGLCLSTPRWRGSWGSVGARLARGAARRSHPPRHPRGRGSGASAGDREPCSLGISPRTFYAAGVKGAFCDDATRKRLRQVGDEFPWEES